jgi:hypothetical protein
VADQPDQKQPGTTLAFQEALSQAIELWDKTPVSILDQQAVQTHALLLARLGLYQTSYKRPMSEIEWLRWSVKLRPADTRQDWRPGTAKLVGVAGMAAGYFCEEWHGQPTEKGPVEFSPHWPCC